jgi:type IV secretory pathway protease TraF
VAAIGFPTSSSIIRVGGISPIRLEAKTTLTGNSCPVEIYRLVLRRPRHELVESCLPYAIASYAIERNITIPTSALTEGPLVKTVSAVSGDRVEVSKKRHQPERVGTGDPLRFRVTVPGKRCARVALGQYQTEADEVWLFSLNDKRIRSAASSYSARKTANASSPQTRSRDSTRI